MLNKNRKILIIGALVLSVVYLAKGQIMKNTRGLMNNNPLNIKHGSSKWDGMRDTQSDAVFVQFIDPLYGLRAGTKLILNYERLYGLNTVRGIISRWAPPVENDTAAYIDFVANALRVSPDAILNTADDAMIVTLLGAMVTMENGSNPYSSTTMATAVKMGRN